MYGRAMLVDLNMASSTKFVGKVGIPADRTVKMGTPNFSVEAPERFKKAPAIYRQSDSRVGWKCRSRSTGSPMGPRRDSSSSSEK